MAYGFIEVIPASSHAEIALSGTGGGSEYPSIKILNPNDGVVYVARNRDINGVNQGAWDWKVPSQSYAAVPGPFTSVGLFYLDQSGAGHQGEITVYPSTVKLDDPMFVAIGRALLAATTSMDVTEGSQPANPGAGILRIWADGTNNLHSLTSDGVDRTYVTIEGVETIAGAKTFTPSVTFNGTPAITLIGQSGGFTKAIAWADAGAGLSSILGNTVGGAPSGCALRFDIANGTPNGSATALTLFGTGMARIENGLWLVATQAPVTTGADLGIGGTTFATATAGPNGAPPTTVAGYISAYVGGAARRIPYYNA